MRNERKIGIAISYLNIVLQTAIGFIYVPLLLHYIGQAEYGLYQLIGSLIAYFGIMDFGLTAAVVRFYTRYKALGDREGMENILAIALAGYILVMVLCVGIGAVCYVNIDTLFATSLTATELAEARLLFILLLANIVISLSTMIFTAVINAHERFLVLRGLTTVQLVLQPILVVLVLRAEPTALAVATVQTALGAVLSIARIYYCYHSLRMRVRYHYFDWALLTDFRRLALSCFLVGVIDQIFFKTNQIILGIIASTSMVAVYSIASTIYMNYMSLSTAISGVYLPHVTEMVARRASAAELSALFTRIGRYQYYLLALVASGFIVFGREFIGVWAGESFADAYYMTLLIIIPFTVDLIQNIGLSIMQAQNTYNVRAWVYLVMGVLNLALAIPLGLAYGGIGCAAATGASMFLGNGVIMNIYYARVTGLDIAGFWRGIGRISVVVVMALACGLAINAAIGEGSAARLAAKVALYTAIYSALVYRLAMNDDERSRVLGLVRL